MAHDCGSSGTGIDDGLLQLGGARDRNNRVEVKKKRALLVVTPFCSPNYTYPAPSYLTRYLRRNGYEVAQADLSIELMLKMFSKQGLERIFAAAEPKRQELGRWARRVLEMKSRYLSTVDTVIRYLQGRDASVAYRICHPGFLPRGENFENNKGYDWFDGTGNTLPIHDRAKFLGTQYLYDVGGLIREAVFPYLQITLVDRLYDSFVHWCTTFDAMRNELEREPTVIDDMLHECLDAHLASSQPDVVGVSVPFARNLYWAFRIGRRAKEKIPSVKVAAGGGLFNTSMRKPKDARLFDYVDYITLDDGERPMQHIMEHVGGARPVTELKRTWYRSSDGAITYSDGSKEGDAKHEDAGAPDYVGLKLDQYFSTLETNNVNQRVRSDGWWNKMTMAHGCYWKKCSFCDIHLSYVGDYETATAKNLVDKVEELIAQTGHTGFHFVDEAMPPKIMRDFALEVLRRKLNISWHGMMRFDKSYTPEICRLLAESGLIAIFGGLEVASNRLLDLMKKGTSVEQVACVAKNFKDAGIKVHAYIMYGFPTQTAQETIDALDVVRQLFKNGLLTSASWAKFGVTPHSPIGRNPEEYGIEVQPVPEEAFIEQILLHKDPANDHEKFTDGLMRSVKLYALGYHHDTPSEGWFDFPVPYVSIDRDLIAKVLAQHALPKTAESAEAQRPRRALWLGGTPSLRFPPPKLGEEPQAELVLHESWGEHVLEMPAVVACWLYGVLERAQTAGDGPMSMSDLETAWKQYVDATRAHTAAFTPPQQQVAPPTFDRFLESPVWSALREHGLVLTEVQQRVIWTGAAPQLRIMPPPADAVEPQAQLLLDEGQIALDMPARWATWLIDVLGRTVTNPSAELLLADLQRSWVEQVAPPMATAWKPTETPVGFQDFLSTPLWRAVRERGLMLL